MAGKIKLLSPTLAERIAAGEVIERPASVVKELVENSLDAGATEIAITLEDGGKSLIEVLDNGEGMAPEDLEISIERHATSKLKALEDLENICTLGFRGEALPSIAAASDLSILSRNNASDSAYELSAGEIAGRLHHKPQAQKVTFGRFIDSTHGTRIQARSLFSQIPVRLKFLKSQNSEVTQVREWIERISLAYPQVGFRLFSDDRTVLNLRPQDEKSRVQLLLTDGEDFPLITVTNEQDGFRDLGLQLRIHWIQGLSSPHTRKLIQVVNLRAIRDRLLQQALLSPFRQALLPGQFPALALFIEINPAAIDVNVHPTKNEIRFLESQKIFHTIESLVKSMIAQKGNPAIAPTQSSPSFEPLQTSSSPSLSILSSPPWEARQWQANEPLFQPGSPSPFQPTAQPAVQLALNPEGVPSSDNYLAQASQQFPGNSPFLGTRYAGSLFNTYLLFEKPDELILLDQHAAHERVRYETLRRRVFKTSTPSHLNTSVFAQALLIPETVRFPTEERALLESRLPWLIDLGFEVEIFGEDTLLFRSIPADWGTHELKPRLRNLVDRTLSIERAESSVLLDETLFEALASEACHSAIRAGDRLEHEEVLSLVQELFQCEHPWNCPHGRPTVVKISQNKFEEWFQRKPGS